VGSAVADSSSADAVPGDPTPARPSPEGPTRRRRIPRATLVGTVTLVVVLADQVSKHWALVRLGDGSTVDLVGSLRLTLAFNTGTAFSLGDDLELGPVIAVLALAVVAWLLLSGHSATRGGALAAGLVAGGALGNLIDRALRSGPYGAPAGVLGGAVVDFIDLQWWPVFNVADAGIVVGALALVLTSFRTPRPDGGR